MSDPRVTDCPTCPHCGVAAGVPIRVADWNHRADSPSRLVCPACGSGWVGTDAEVAQADRAQAAWERQQRREERGAKRQARMDRDLEKLRRARRGEW